MSLLAIKPELLEQIKAAAEAAYPEEACGILLGRELPPQANCPEGVSIGDSDTYRRCVERMLPAPNIRPADERHRRFTIDPKALLQAERAATAAGQVVLGFYHSHPDHPAKPSATDLANAWPVYSYLIVCVEKGKARGLTSWRLVDDGSPASAQQAPLAEGRFVEEIVA